MDYILAIVFPCVVLFFKGRWGAALGLLVLQLTGIGWPIATAVAWMIINEENRRRDLRATKKR